MTAAVKSVSRGHPCAVCEAVHGCSRTADDCFMCRKRTGPQPGFVFLGQARNNNEYSLYRREGDPRLNGDGERKPISQPKPARSPDWSAKVAELQAGLETMPRRQLAEALGLPEAVLSSLPIGWTDRGPHKEPGGPCWTFPEVDGAGRIVGITCRYADGSKKAWPGSNRGLTVPSHWQERDGPVLLVEGASDTLTLTALGLPAIGRPNNLAGADQLAVLLKDLPPAREIVVLGEWDPKADGTWPGKEGAIKVSGELAAKLNRPVAWSLPPMGRKDARAWLAIQDVDMTCADDLAALGERFVAGLELHAAGTKDVPGHGLLTTCLATIKPRPVRWVVPGRIPLGKVGLLAGDGGGCKSYITLTCAADLTRGRPWFNLDYEPVPAAEVLLISCEDDYADTVIPRLLAAGADLGKIFKVDGILGKDGKPMPFHMQHFEAMERELEAHPDIRLVIIDPAGAYIGKAGVDDHKDSELRTLLDPLAELAAKRNVTILIVKHLCKGATTKAVHKVAGSAGYVNSVRFAYIVCQDPDDDTTKMLLPIKFNLGPKPGGLTYRLADLEQHRKANILSDYCGHLDWNDQQELAGQLSRIHWLGKTDTDADSAMGERRQKAGDSLKVDRCAEWLQQFLAVHAYPSEEVFTAAESAGFNQDNCYRAKGKLNGKVKAKNNGFGGVWHWGLGDPASWQRRPENSEDPKQS